jgi:hypothetical protein
VQRYDPAADPALRPDAEHSKGKVACRAAPGPELARGAASGRLLAAIGRLTQNDGTHRVTVAELVAWRSPALVRRSDPRSRSACAPAAHATRGGRAHVG